MDKHAQGGGKQRWTEQEQMLLLLVSADAVRDQNTNVVAIHHVLP